MHVQVVIQSEDGRERTETFPVGRAISIGRHPTCVLRLDSDLVSRQHAVVEPREGSIIVEDVSTNGTIAGDMLLKRNIVEVPYGTPIVVGDFTVFFFPADAQEMQPTQGGAQTGGHGVQGMQHTGGHPTAMNPTHPPGMHAQTHGATQAPPTFNPQDPTGALRHAQQHLGSYMGPTGQHPVVNGMNGMNGMQPNMNATGQVPVMGGPNGMTAPNGVHHAGHLAHQIPPNAPVAAAQQMPVRHMDDARKKDVELRRDIHKALLEHLDLATIDAKKLDDPSMRPKVLNALRRIVGQMDARVPKEMDRDTLIGELSDEALGLGPLERFLSDPTVSEIMVVDPNTIYVEHNGKIRLSEARFTDDERVRAVIERIVTPLGRRIDESSPLVDARLKDGSRVNAVIKPIALRGSCITIRKFAKVPLTLEKLIGYGTCTEQMALFLTRSVIAKKNIVISGGTGSGKTTLLNVLSGVIPEDERIVTIEDAAELQLKQPHVVALETRPANLEGRGEYTIRDLVKNALRMRPDRIVVGECRGGEALDMLQAMNTGHDGSLTTTHANSPKEAIARLETLVLMAGVDLPVRAIREQIAGSVHVIVQQSRLSDGSRKITAISEVVGLERDTGEIETLPIFEFVRTGTGAKGKVIGDFRATGYLPSYLNDFIVMGLVKRGEKYL
jgi:pilus assembly protein CpaF